MQDLTRLMLTAVMTATLSIAGCGDDSPTDADSTAASHDDHDHGNDGDSHGHADEGHDHAEEVPLGSVTIGADEVELAQGHGTLAPGKEMHLVVKLPYNDNGATTVRAWIGTEDRLASVVAKGEYAPSHDDYDLHVVAPDPLPDGAAWWIELEKPDGTKEVGSIAPIVE